MQLTFVLTATSDRLMSAPEFVVLIPKSGR